MQNSVHIHFEKMLLSDLDEVMTIENQNYEVPWSLSIMQDCIKAGHHCIVMKQSEDIVGYAFLMTGYHESHLLNMSIAKSHQRKGYGRRFLNYLNNICLYSHSETFLLEVRVSNLAAQALYTAFGFKEVGRRKNYYRCLQGREDAIVMTKKIMEVKPTKR